MSAMSVSPDSDPGRHSTAPAAWTEIGAGKGFFFDVDAMDGSGSALPMLFHKPHLMVANLPAVTRRGGPASI